MVTWAALHYTQLLPFPSARLLHIGSVIGLVPDSLSRHNVRLYATCTMYGSKIFILTYSFPVIL
jgi:hypothetical protein